MDADARGPSADQVARYSNDFKVGQNAFEFLIEFGQSYADTERPRVLTRIVTSPRYARRLFDVLRVSIEAHEREFGAIKVDSEPTEEEASQDAS